MNLRLFLRAMALAGGCALPLQAGVLTFTIAETGTNQITVTAYGALTESSLWTYDNVYDNSTTGFSSGIDPAQPSLVLKDGSGFRSDFLSTVAPVITSGFGSGSALSGFSIASAGSPSGTAGGLTVGFMEVGGPWLLYLPATVVGSSPATPYIFGGIISSTEVFTDPSANFASLGLVAGTSQSYVFGSGSSTDTITVNISGGASGVPDTGTSAAGLGLAFAGLQLLRRRIPGALQR